MKKVLTALLVILLVGSFLGTGYYLYSKSQEKPIVYETDEAFYTDIVNKTVATGAITPRMEVDVKSQVPGIIDKLYVKGGEQVREGQVLAKVKIIPDVVAVNNAQATLQTARINQKNAERERDRQRKLFDQKVISAQEFNQFQLDYDLRQQEVAAARENLQLVREGASSGGNVSNLVRATMSGMVLDVPVEQGTFIIESNSFNEGTTIATVADMTDMIFEGKVDESEVGKLQAGMPLLLKVGALPDGEFDATLEYIAPKGVEEEGAIQFEIRAAIGLDTSRFLRAGYSANADIVLDRRDSVLAVRESTLIFEGDKTFVEVETAPQTFERREVRVGLSDGINIEVKDGIGQELKLKKPQAAAS